MAFQFHGQRVSKLGCALNHLPSYSLGAGHGNTSAACNAGVQWPSRCGIGLSPGDQQGIQLHLYHSSRGCSPIKHHRQELRAGVHRVTSKGR